MLSGSCVSVVGREAERVVQPREIQPREIRWASTGLWSPVPLNISQLLKLNRT
jgi:hypothetical protein